jgi:ubiquinone/menaquinone biosynthesis C-methylase UbiE
VGWFRRTAPSEPLAVTMAAVKLGDRFLAVGVDDPPLIAALASKSGLTGQARVIDPDAERLEQARAAIEGEGALVDVIRAPWGLWPLDAGSVDVAVISNLLPTLPADARGRSVAETLRVLRPGGRVVVIESVRRGGIAALMSKPNVESSYAGAVQTLKDEGFAAVRQLAETGGVIYVEGIKKG